MDPFARSLPRARTSTASVPATMRALVRGVDGVTLAEVSTPRHLAADEVLLRVLVAGLCRTDCYVAEGRLGGAGERRILGHELAAEVVAAGPEVVGVALGERVSVDPRIPCRSVGGACRGCARGRSCEAPRFLGVDVDGGFADYVRVPASAVVRVPGAAHPELRALAYVEPIAATSAVLDAGIGREERGVVAGSGRIASLCVELLRARGFTRVDRFDPAVDRPPTPGVYDFAIESGVDRRGLAATIVGLRRRGRLVLKSRRLDPLVIDPLAIVPKELRLVCAYYGSFAEAAALVAGGALDLEPLWATPRPLEDFAAVFAAARRGEGRKLFFAIGGAARPPEERGCVGSSAPSP